MQPAAFATKRAQQHDAIVIYVDGAGCGPHGIGSGYAWKRLDTQEHRVFWSDGLTNNQAEYRAVISALKKAPPGSKIEIRSDSQLVCCQFAGKYAVNDPKLRRLLARVKELIVERHLEVNFVWISRGQNLAGKLLEGKPTREPE